MSPTCVGFAIRTRNLESGQGHGAIAALLALTLFGSVGCGGTGSALVEFPVHAAGPATARPGEPLRFTTPLGFDVELTRTRLHVGAIYLNAGRPLVNQDQSDCRLPTPYVAEVRGGLTIDVLNPEPQSFPVPGRGVDSPAQSAELWLTGGPIDAEQDSTVIADIEGIARKDIPGNPTPQAWPFRARLTIGAQRRIPSDNPALPGKNPLCRQRIVGPIPVDITPRDQVDGGALLLRIHPAGWFTSVEFDRLSPDPQDPDVFRFADDLSGPAEGALFAGLHATTGVYRFEFTASPR